MLAKVDASTSLTPLRYNDECVLKAVSANLVLPDECALLATCKKPFVVTLW